MKSFELLTFPTLERVNATEKEKGSSLRKEKKASWKKCGACEKRNASGLTKAALEAAGVRRTGSSEAWMT
jgi:hypothetical protein